MNKHFPKNFYWGASMAAHQVEGGLTNQWSQWETANAAELARTARDRVGWVTAWERVKAEAESPDNYISGAGVDHYHLYEQDFKLARQLNFNALRFGIEWARLEPSEGEWDQDAIRHYQTYIRRLLAAGLEPFPTLWHWTIPVWFARKGGFEKRANLRYFERFVEKAAQELLPGCSQVIILNEPNVYSALSYMSGEWPPQKCSKLAFAAVYRNLAAAHITAHRVIRRHRPKCRVGIAIQINNHQPKSPSNPIHRLSAAAADYAWNWWFLDRIKRHLDFIGANYYFTDYFDRPGHSDNPDGPKSDLGWYMEPSGIYHVIMRTWRRYRLPIIITENGLADGLDQHRGWWIDETIKALRHALADGANLQGYLHWSLLDNFEWKYGWWPKFGLIAVDRSTMKRSIRPSAKHFAKQLEVR